MRLRLPVVLVLALLLFVPAVAGEIIHFTSGTTMAIESHLVKDDMIHVDLGGGSGLAFPVAMVESITRSGRSVYNPDSPRTHANVASSNSFQGVTYSGGASFSSSRSGNSGRGSGVAAAAAALDKLNEMQEASDRGAGKGVIYPLSNHPNRAARQIGVQADMRIYGQSATQRHNGSTNTDRKANTVSTPSGGQILGGEPPDGRDAKSAVEVFPLGLSNRLKQARAADGSSGDARFIPGAVEDR
jgi:hypothetical protein